MEDIQNEIQFYGMKPNRALRKQVEHKLKKWLRRKTQWSSIDEAFYRVCIEREGRNCLCCHLELQVGKQKWEAHDIGKSVQDALGHALQHVVRSISFFSVDPSHSLITVKNNV